MTRRVSPARNILGEIRDAIAASSVVALVALGCYLAEPHQPAEKQVGAMYMPKSSSTERGR